MVVMSRDVIEAPPPQRLFQRSAAGRQRPTTTTRYALTASRHNGNPVDPLPLSLPPPPSEDTYLLRSVKDKKDVFPLDDTAVSMTAVSVSVSVSVSVRAVSVSVSMSAVSV